MNENIRVTVNRVVLKMVQEIEYTDTKERNEKYQQHLLELTASAKGHETDIIKQFEEQKANSDAVLASETAKWREIISALEEERDNSIYENARFVFILIPFDFSFV